MTTYEIPFNTRAAAENTLDQLEQVLSARGTVYVNDLNQLAGIKSSPSGMAYGWLNLSGAVIKRVRPGYLLILPQPVPMVKPPLIPSSALTNGLAEMTGLGTSTIDNLLLEGWELRIELNNPPRWEKPLRFNKQ